MIEAARFSSYRSRRPHNTPAQSDEDDHEHDDDRRKVHEEIVEGQSRPARDDEIGRIADERRRPPILLAMASARKGMGGSAIRSHNNSVTGATSRTVVTLSKQRRRGRGDEGRGGPSSGTAARVPRCADQIARNSNTWSAGGCRRAPSSRTAGKTTFQFRSRCRRRTGSAHLGSLDEDHDAAPLSATAARLTSHSR